MPLSKPLILFVLLLFASSASAIQGGVVLSDSAGARRSVVAIIGPRGKCSGTVIARRLVVTAAHCVREQGRYTLRLVTPDFETQDVKVEASIVHPDYAASRREGRYLAGAPHNDLALVRTAADLPSWIVPAKLGDPFGEAPMAGEEDPYFVAGFGPPNDREARHLFGTLRARSFSRMQAGPSRNLLLDLEDGGACIGDSGGPVFRARDENKLLIAVMSSVGGPKGTLCGSNLLAVPLAAARDFLEREAAKIGQSVTFE